MREYIISKKSSASKIGKLLPLLVALLFWPTQAKAATTNININVGQGPGVITQDYANTITVSGATGGKATLLINQNFSLLGTAQQSPLVLPQTLNTSVVVNNGQLNFGTGTDQLGGILNGNVELNNATLEVIGNTNRVLYSLTSTNGATGSLTQGEAGKLILRQYAQFRLDSIGEQTNPLESTSLDEHSTLQIRGDIHVKDLYLDNSATLTSLEGNLNILDSTVQLQNGSRLMANEGNIILGDTSSSSPSETLSHWFYGGTIIESRKGDVSIDGHLKVTQGLSNVIAAGNIYITRGGTAEVDGGELHLQAGPVIPPGSDMIVPDGVGNIVGEGDINALEVDAKGTVSAQNLTSQNLQAKRIDISQNADISSFRVLLTGTGDQKSHVGGNLTLSGLAQTSTLGDIEIDGNATVNNVTTLSFGNMTAGGDATFSGGTLTGTNLTADSITTGGAQNTTSLTADNLIFDKNLHVGANSKVVAQTIATQNRAQAVEPPQQTAQPGANDALFTSALNISGGTITVDEKDFTATGPQISLAGSSIDVLAGNLNLGGAQNSSITLDNSRLSAGSDINLKNDATATSSTLIAGQDVNASGAISDGGSRSTSISAGRDIVASGNIEAGAIQAAGQVKANNITASSLWAQRLETNGNVEVLGPGRSSRFNLSGTGDQKSVIGGNLTLSSLSLPASLADMDIGGNATITSINGTYGNVTAKGDVNFSQGTLAGTSLTADSITIGGNQNATSLTAASLVFDKNLHVGSNSKVVAKAIATQNRAQAIEPSQQTAQAGANDALFANVLNISGGTITVDEKDFTTTGPQISMTGSSADVLAGNLNLGGAQNSIITLDNSRLAAGSDINLKNDATATSSILIAGQDVNVSGSISDGGSRSTSISAGRDIVATGNIEAGPIQASGQVKADNITASSLSAKRLETNGNVEVLGPGRSTTLNLSGTGDQKSVVGGNLTLSSLSLPASLADMDIGGNATITSVNGSFGNVASKGDLNFSQGTLAGTSLTADSITTGGGQNATFLAATSLVFDKNLHVGANSRVVAQSIATQNRAQAVEPPQQTSQAGPNDALFTGSLNISGGSITVDENDFTAIGPQVSIEESNVAATAGSINLGSLQSRQVSVNNSHLTAANDINFNNAATAINSNISAEQDINASASVSDSGSRTTSITAGRNISAAGDLRAATIHAGEKIKANNIGAGSLITQELEANGNVTVNDFFLVEKPGTINGNLNLIASSSSSPVLGAFNNLAVGQSVVLSGARVAGWAMSAKSILAASDNLKTELSIASLYSPSALGLGKNAFVTIGWPYSAWLEGNMPAGIHSGLALNTPIVTTGLTVDGSSPTAPIPTLGAIKFAPDSFLLINGPAAMETNTPQGIISANSPTTAIVEEGSKLAFSETQANKVYVVLGNNIATQYASENAWGENSVESGSHLIALKKIPDRPGSFIAETKPSSEVYPPIDGELGGVIDGSTGANKPKPPVTGPGTPAGPDQPETPSTPDTSPVTPPGTPPLPGSPPPADINPDLPIYPAQPVPPATPDTPPDIGTSPNPPAELPFEPIIGPQDKFFNSSIAGIRFLSRVTSVKYMDHDYNLAAKTIESAARMAILGAVPQMTREANLASATAAQTRASFNDKHGLMLATDSMELRNRNISLWITPMFKSISAFDMHANNFSYDFNGGMGGFTMGADITFGDSLRAGIDFSMGGGYAQSGGDLARTTNNMGFVGAGVYAGWTKNGFGLAADAQYTASWNSLKQEMPASMEMNDPTGELTARAISAGLKAYYSMPLGNWTLTPHAGARFIYLQTDNYSMYSNGALLDGATVQQSIWTFPVGIELKGLFTNNSGWTFSPYLDLEIIPAAGGIEAGTTVQFTGTPDDATIYTQTMNYFTAGGTVGLEAAYGDFALGISYNINAGTRGTTQAIFGNLRYEF